MDVIEAWRRSNNKRCSCERCFYCDRELDVHQHDHYPVPKRAGGTRTVPACSVCHELKDRIPLQFWHPDVSGAASEELWRPRLDVLRQVGHEAAFGHCYLEIEAEWGTLSPLARLLYAKVRSVYEDGLYLDKMKSQDQPVRDPGAAVRPGGDARSGTQFAQEHPVAGAC